MEQIAHEDGEAELFEVWEAISAKLSDRHAVSLSVILRPCKVPPRCRQGLCATPASQTRNLRVCFTYFACSYEATFYLLTYHLYPRTDPTIADHAETLPKKSV